jgi:hypothetical protein
MKRRSLCNFCPVLFLGLLLGACSPLLTAEKCKVATMAGPGGTSGNGYMTMVQGTAGCNIRYRTNGEAYSSIDLRQAPQHGTVRVWTGADGSYARYIPAAGYAGTDTFLVGLGPTFLGTVSVEVLP